jgi:hypothetical protein
MPKPDLTSLPPAVLDLWRDVELRSGNNIVWRVVTQCAGCMSTHLDGDIPVIECKEYTESGLAEELMHLLMRLDGSPDLWVPPSGPLKDALEMLGGLREHILIFPKLRQMGYDPSAEEAVEKQLRDLVETHQPEFSRIDQEPCLRAMYAMLYARSLIEICPGALRDECDVVFEKYPELRVCKRLGQRTAETLLKAGSSPDDAEQALQDCLDTLGIEEDTDVVSNQGVRRGFRRR